MQTPILGFAAYSGTGKTTLLEKLIPLLRESGVRVAILKHAHHDFDIDKPGKDSYRLRKAGAQQMIIASDQRWAMMVETLRPTDFTNLLDQFNHAELDLIIVEGFKGEAIPKIELHRASLGHNLICTSPDLLSNFIAVASDTKIELPVSVCELNINQPAQIAGFIQNTFLNND